MIVNLLIDDHIIISSEEKMLVKSAPIATLVKQSMYDLNTKFNLPSVLHNTQGPAIMDLRNQRESYFKNGKHIKDEVLKGPRKQHIDLYCYRFVICSNIGYSNYDLHLTPQFELLVHYYDSFNLIYPDETWSITQNDGLLKMVDGRTKKNLYFNGSVNISAKEYESELFKRKFNQLGED